MSKLNKPKADLQTYTFVGAIFLVAGILFLVNEYTRSVSVAFLILGSTFLVLGLSKKNDTRK